MKSLKIPQTNSIEELARFWDTHDLTDFEDQLEEVTPPVFERQLEAIVTVHLQRSKVEMVKQIAKSKGVEPTALLREWVLEKLHKSY